SRRGILRGGIGALAVSALTTLGLNATSEVQAKHKGPKHKKGHKKGKPKPQGCLTVGGRATCPGNLVCCHPQFSTGGGCAPSNAPVCCVASGFAHPLGATCCSDPSSGSGGVCESPDHPHCCAAPLSGCCQAGFPVCCPDPILGGGYCCPAGATCCPES